MGTGCGMTHAKAFSVAEVYVLTCPLTGAWRYVGFSRVSALQRLRSHLSDDAMGPVRDWVRSLRPLGPGLEYAARDISEPEARALEAKLIRETPGLLNRKRRWVGKRRIYDTYVIDGYDWVKWWRTQLNDELGPWHGPDLKRRL